MQDDFYMSRKAVIITSPSRRDDGPDILRVDNCSEIFYKQDGKYYDYKTGNTTAKYYCCDFENEDAPECADLSWLIFTIFGIFGICAAPTFFFSLYWIISRLYRIIRRFYDCVIQKSLVYRLPRSKASVDQCTGRGNYFFWKLIIKYIEDNSCSICMVKYELDSDLVTLPCLHIFHYECTKQWIRILPFECPVCRTRVD